LSREYFVKEAIVIGFRRVVDEAIKCGMIDLSISKRLGVSTTLNVMGISPGPSATGCMTELGH
jgi:hypothetical protein